jgi:prefoldin subunit 5
MPEAEVKEKIKKLEKDDEKITKEITELSDDPHKGRVEKRLDTLEKKQDEIKGELQKLYVLLTEPATDIDTELPEEESEEEL